MVLPYSMPNHSFFKILKSAFHLTAGTAVAMVPDSDMLAAMEASQAVDTMRSEPQAAAAYDRIPFSSGSCVFTMDTSSEILLLHSMQVGSIMHAHDRKVLCRAGWSAEAALL